MYLVQNAEKQVSKRYFFQILSSTKKIVGSGLVWRWIIHEIFLWKSVLNQYPSG